MTQLQNTLLRALLFAAIALSLTMALLSPTTKQVHHDEYDHVNAARFYTTHWLPPAAGDPRALDSYSLYGASYLDEWDIVYFLAGKFAAILNPLVDNLTLSLRLFNVTLFLLLGCVALLAPSAVLGYAVLLTSPQIWYTFSYFNGDSFPLFISFLIVAILAAPEDALSRGSRRILYHYLLLGICIGLLVLSKKSFWAFGLFAAGVAAWLEFCRWRRDKDSRGFLRNMAFLATIVIMTAGPRIAYDFYINGGPAEKRAKRLQVAEELAAPVFKPSTLAAFLRSPKRPMTLEERVYTISGRHNLRGQGVSVLDMMKPPLSWVNDTFFTMFGAYNYNTIRSRLLFYSVILGAYCLFLIYLTAIILGRSNTRERVILLGALATAALVTGLSIHHSWVSEFQPQGRYLFAIFSLVAVVLARNRTLLRPVVVNLFLISVFLLSVYSFARGGLVHAPHFRDISEINEDFRKPD